MIMHMLQILGGLRRIRKNTKSAERQKSSSPKESVENTDFYKPVWNKIMITLEYGWNTIS